MGYRDGDGGSSPDGDGRGGREGAGGGGREGAGGGGRQGVRGGGGQEGAKEKVVMVLEKEGVLEEEVVRVSEEDEVPEVQEEEGVSEAERVPYQTPDLPNVVFVSEGTKEVVPMVGEGVSDIGRVSRIVDVPELVVGKRPRAPSQYVVSPFTAEAKRKRFVEGTHPNLFREVDHAKWKAFEAEWRALMPEVSPRIAHKTISEAYKWFHDITTSGGLARR
ncbi:uncharacterized protein LOC111372800 [Olea europaea var. sylvestris]|uniref:uncharacterized protein LOC111372800 n=1 Tax=Olea europaea var. sylvestris TaxID=158386 RepID=UPI000C1D8485|nr:uncharacterized protein LOC111372800 [Olea europaea var. sylvestris]